MKRIGSPAAILSILAFINFFNYVDRQVMGPLAVLLGLPVDQGGLGIAKPQLGLLHWAFMVVHSLASVPLGILADRYLRNRLIAFGVGLWSIATALAGFAQSFRQLFFARAAVGIGEATYAPAATSLISDTFSSAARARALGVFQLGMILGGACGVIVGGLVGEAYGWRAAFFVVGLPGLLLAVLALMIRERHPGDSSPTQLAIKALDPARRTPRVSLALETRELLRSPALVWINVAGILITFFTGALIFWAAAFILETQYGGNPKMLGKVSLQFGLIATIAGVAGTLTGSFVADRLERRRPGEGRLLTIALGTFLTVPCSLVACYAPNPTVLLVALSVGVFFNVWYVGPILAALHDVVAPSRRGTATGMYLLLVHLLGDAISPAVVAWVADRTDGLRTGFLVATVVLGLGGVAALLALPTSRRVAELKGLRRPR